jgi:hypothetical protein
VEIARGNVPGGLERRVRPAEPDGLDGQPDVRVARLAAREHGVVSLDELRACGLKREAVGVRVRNGRLHPLHRGVYAVGHARPTLEGLFLAAVKACGAGAVLSHFAAAVLWGLLVWDGRRVEVTVRGPGTRTHPRLRVHRTAHLEPEDIRVRYGIAVTSPARTLLDLASVLPYAQLRRAARQAQSLGLVTLGELVAVLQRPGPRRGRSKLARIVAAGPAPTRSELEDIVLDLLLGAGFERPDVNVPLVLGGRRVIPDFRWPGERLVVEADGAAWHDNPTAREDDAERQALLEAHGERVIRVTFEQAVARAAETRRRIGAAGAPLRV